MGRHTVKCCLWTLSYGSWIVPQCIHCSCGYLQKVTYFFILFYQNNEQKQPEKGRLYFCSWSEKEYSPLSQQEHKLAAVGHAAFTIRQYYVFWLYMDPQIFIRGKIENKPIPQIHYLTHKLNMKHSMCPHNDVSDWLKLF